VKIFNQIFHSKTSTFVLSGMTGGLKSTKHQQANTEATKQRADPTITSPETCRYRDYTTRDIYTCYAIDFS
jgi:uncharacterized membrane protein